MLCKSVLVTISILLVICCSGFSGGRFSTVVVSGHILADIDSAAVPGAMILIEYNFLGGYSPIEVYSDSLGYFEYTRHHPTEPYNEFILELLVADVDEEENGVFISTDTLLSKEAAEDVAFQVDIYVVMAGD